MTVESKKSLIDKADIANITAAVVIISGTIISSIKGDTASLSLFGAAALGFLFGRASK